MTLSQILEKSKFAIRHLRIPSSLQENVTICMCASESVPSSQGTNRYNQLRENEKGMGAGLFVFVCFTLSAGEWVGEL